MSIYLYIYIYMSLIIKEKGAITLRGSWEGLKGGKEWGKVI